MKLDLCLIISGGEYCELPDELRRADYVIACDRGWQYAAQMGLRPDWIVGDFDSAPQPETEIPVTRVPTRKDDTDTMLAVRRAFELGYREIAILCAFGGRLDHTLANLQTAAWLVSRGAKVRLVGADTDALAFTQETLRLPRREGWSLSVFSLSDACTGVTIRGAKYECENETLSNRFPLGISNVWASDAAEISVQSGILLVLQSRLSPGEHI
ncbi:MAG: thiamine diphosphokinase [Oscillospiraceae bacterium]|nr:thiamine diphosphokinase [Oscillospiraceae bacterium]